MSRGDSSVVVRTVDKRRDGNEVYVGPVASPVGWRERERLQPLTVAALARVRGGDARD